MNCNLRTFALSKKFLLLEKTVTNYTDSILKDFLNSCDVSATRIPLLVQYTLMQYGKSMTGSAFLSLCQSSPEEQVSVANDVEIYLVELFGNHGSFDTLFGDFPNTVLNMSEFEMAVHTLVQYFTDGAYFPKDFNIKSNFTDAEDNTNIDWNLCVKDNYDLIEATDYIGLSVLYKNLLCANQSLTDFDKKAVIALGDSLGEHPEMAETLIQIEDIPFKETLCLAIDSLGFKPKTVTDILRYAVYLSGGDVSLPSIPKTVSTGWNTRKATKEDNRQYNFKRFTRKERRMILSMIESLISTPNGYNPHVLEDMKKHLTRWIRLGECIHPSEYTKAFPTTASAFSVLRNTPKKIKTWASRVDSARQEFNFDKMMELYSQRPGEFIRALDSVIRLFGEDDAIIEVLSKVIGKVSTKLLIEVSEHFHCRNEKYPRFIKTKGSRTAIELKTLEPMSEDYIGKILTVITLELVNRFSLKNSFEGKNVYISKDVAKILLPTNMRSANLSNTQVPRGSRLPLPKNQDLIRFYCHWIDKFGTEDLDLSAIFVKDNGKTEHISWNSSFKNGVAIFSGDVRHHKGNCAEYIDVSLSKAIENGYKYIAVCVSDYEGHNFNGCQSYAGFMARDTWGTKGEKTWAPETVESEFLLSSNCQKILMGIVDLENKEYIFADEDFEGIPVTASANGEPAIVKAIDRLVIAKLWNAEKLLLLNLYAQSLNFDLTYKSGLEDEEVTKMKEDNEKSIQALKDSLPKQIELLSKLNLPAAEYQASYDRLTKEYEQRIQSLEKNVFITYQDVAKDYSVLFEWL